MRRINVRRKLNAMALEFTGKSVLIVDGTYIILFYFTIVGVFEIDD